MAASLLGLGGVATIATTSSTTVASVLYDREGHLGGTPDGGNANIYRLRHSGFRTDGTTASTDLLYVRVKYTTGDAMLCNGGPIFPGEVVLIQGGGNSSEISTIEAWGRAALPNQANAAGNPFLISGFPQGAH